MYQRLLQLTELNNKLLEELADLFDLYLGLEIFAQAVLHPQLLVCELLGLLFPETLH